MNNIVTQSYSIGVVKTTAVVVMVLTSMGFDIHAANENSDRADEPKSNKRELLTFSLVTPIVVDGMIPQEEDQYPRMRPPTKIDPGYLKPTKVWRNPLGYFASFDRGEFGGALFFAQDNAKHWTKLLAGNVQELASFDDESFIAVGGLSHLGQSEGRVFLIKRKPDGSWSVRVVFETNAGEPRIIGQTTSNPARPVVQKLLVICVDQPNLKADNPLIGVSCTGLVHFLGWQKQTR